MIVFPLAIIAVFLFGYFRNRQANRNDARRERFWEKEEELMNLLNKRKDENDNQVLNDNKNEN
jgi:hypothetical protein